MSFWSTRFSRNYVRAFLFPSVHSTLRKLCFSFVPSSYPPPSSSYSKFYQIINSNLVFRQIVKAFNLISSRGMFANPVAAIGNNSNSLSSHPLPAPPPPNVPVFCPTNVRRISFRIIYLFFGFYFISAFCWRINHCRELFQRFNAKQLQLHSLEHRARSKRERERWKKEREKVCVCVRERERERERESGKEGGRERRKECGGERETFLCRAWF